MEDNSENYGGADGGQNRSDFRFTVRYVQAGLAIVDNYEHFLSHRQKCPMTDKKVSDMSERQTEQIYLRNKHENRSSLSH